VGARAAQADVDGVELRPLRRLERVSERLAIRAIEQLGQPERLDPDARS